MGWVCSVDMMPRFEAHFSASHQTSNVKQYVYNLDVYFPKIIHHLQQKNRVPLASGACSRPLNPLPNAYD